MKINYVVFMIYDLWFMIYDLWFMIYDLKNEKMKRWKDEKMKRWKDEKMKVEEMNYDYS